ncbi:MAG: two-component system response regulator [Frankiales bacterium]|nr:two-component system response regulator [Frankiales bacterium]
MSLTAVESRGVWVVTVVHSHLLVAEVVGLWLGRSPRLSCQRPVADLSSLPGGAQAYDGLVVDQRAFDAQGAHLLARDRAAVLVVLGDDTSRDPAGDCVRSLRGGARAWVSPDAAPDSLVDALLTALGGGVWLPPHLAGAVVERLLEGERQRPRLDALTARELEVLRHLLAGHSTSRTAELMFVSANTVRSHRNRLFTKLDVHTALEAVAVARAAGLTI